MRRKNYTEFDTEFVILDKRGKNCTRFGLGTPLSGGRPCCGGRFGGHFGRPLKWGVFGDYDGYVPQATSAERFRFGNVPLFDFCRTTLSEPLCGSAKSGIQK